MRIAELHIRGFRNFVDETIRLDEKTLILGGNDTGKSNMLYAIRILFDPSLSARDLELTDSDFNIQSSAEAIEITARLDDIHEDYVNSALQGAVKDCTAFIRYTLHKGKDYEFSTGYDEQTLAICHGRTYIKNIVVEYVGSNRDLATFLRRQQNKLLDIARDQRDEDQAAEDDRSIDDIQVNLLGLNEKINALHYVSESLATVNDEMGALSVSNEGYTAKLVAGNTDAGKLLDNLRLAYLHDEDPLVFGGDGRSNQLYFATWASEQRLTRRHEKAVIFAIEEPEAHLHPHQQRTLAKYLSAAMEGQVLITTHSPQIVERFNEGRILRLSGPVGDGGNQARGCSVDIDQALANMGHRLNAISSEVFFSDGVLLVEGPSERILYTALSIALDKNIDRLNISVLSVDGVGFRPYVHACTELGIPFAVRTDNDVFGLGTCKTHRLAGVKRLADLAEEFMGDDELNKLIKEESDNLSWANADDVPDTVASAAKKLVPALEECGLFLSKHSDLEHDLVDGPLLDQLKDCFGTNNAEDIVKTMQRRKAESMHRFIASNPNLCNLDGDPITAPLDFVVKYVEGRKT